MYNGVYRTMIADNEARKFLDTFVGPTVTAASMMRIFRNGSFSLMTRIALGLFLPVTRTRTLFLLQNFTFTLFKTTIFSEAYLHQRIWRHIFENGCGIMGLSTYYAVFKYKQAFLDPPPETKKPETSTTAPKAGGSTSKKPGYKRQDFEVSYKGNEHEQNNQNSDTYLNENDFDNYEHNVQNSHTPLYGYVSADETNDSWYDVKEPAYIPNSYESNYNPSYDPVETPSVDENILDSFKTIISRFKESGVGEKWAPLSASSI